MLNARRIAYAVTVSVLAVLTFAGPASAQQLIDAGGDNGVGGLAFVALAVMVFAIATAFFFMERIRRRRSGN